MSQFRKMEFSYPCNFGGSIFHLRGVFFFFFFFFFFQFVIRILIQIFVHENTVDPLRGQTALMGLALSCVKI